MLVQLLARDDPRQSSAAEAFVAPGAWVSHLVLVEAVWVLSSVYERDARALAASIGMLLEHQSLVLQDADAVESALADFRARPALGFSDCLRLQVARKAGHLPLGTFDRALGRLPGTARVQG